MGVAVDRLRGHRARASRVRSPTRSPRLPAVPRLMRDAGLSVTAVDVCAVHWNDLAAPAGTSTPPRRPGAPRIRPCQRVGLGTVLRVRPTLWCGDILRQRHHRPGRRPEAASDGDTGTPSRATSSTSQEVVLTCSLPAAAPRVHSPAGSHAGEAPASWSVLSASPGRANAPGPTASARSCRRRRRRLPDPADDRRPARRQHHRHHAEPAPGPPYRHRRPVGRHANAY